MNPDMYMNQQLKYADGGEVEFDEMREPEDGYFEEKEEMYRPDEYRTASSDTYEPIHLTREELENLMSMADEEGQMTEDGYVKLEKLSYLLEDPFVRRALFNILGDRTREDRAEENFMMGEDRGEEGRFAQYSKGGRTRPEDMGIMGDTEIAYVKPHVTEIFDKIIGGSSINPHTGRKQYFLGSLMGGLGRAFGGALTSGGNFLKGLMPVAGNALRGVARSGLQSVGRQIASPDFSMSRRGFANAGRQAFGDMMDRGRTEFNNVRDTAFNRAYDAMGRMPSASAMMPSPAMAESGYGRDFGGAGRAYGNIYGNQAGRMASDFASPHMQRFGQNMGMSPEMAGNFAGRAGGMMQDYMGQMGRNMGQLGGQYAGNFLNSMMGRFGR